MSDKKFHLPKVSAETRRALIRPSLTLLAVCSACALLLSGVNALLTLISPEGTSSAVFSAMERLLPAEEYVLSDFSFDDTPGVNAVYEAKSGGETLGYCAETVSPDYGGDMHAVVAVDAENTVLALEIVSMPDGVGTKVKEESFLSLFKGKSGKLTSVKGSVKDEGQIAAISGATASSSAVCECVNSAVSAVSRISAEKAKEVAAE